MEEVIFASSQKEEAEEEKESEKLIEFLSEESQKENSKVKEQNSLLSNMYPSLRIEYDEYCSTIKDIIEPMNFEDFVQQSQESNDLISPIVPLNFF